MKKLSFLLVLLIFVCFTASAQTSFVHYATTANSTNNYTYLDNAACNGNPNAVIFITAGYATAYKNVGVWYDASRAKWAIFNENKTAQMTANNNRPFHVAIMPTGFIHKATNVVNNYTDINNAACNNNPNAIVFVTQRWNSAAANSGYNDHPVAVWYNTTTAKWSIYNEDMAAMGANLEFNVCVLPMQTPPAINGPSPMVARFTATAGTYMPTNYGDPNDVLIVTHNYNPNGAGGMYVNSPLEIGNEPDTRRWGVWAKTGVSLVNATFNVMKFGKP